MLTTKSFFDLNNFDHRELFSQAYVWESLKNLKQYMSDFAYPEFKGATLPYGEPLPETMVYIAGELVPAREFELKFGDAAKGELAVYQNGARLVGASIIMAGAVLSGPEIALGGGVLVETGAMLKAPTIIGDGSEVRQGAYIRGYCLAGRRCVIGHTTEVKHAIFLDDAKAGHFAYIGDSILGNQVNLGAGTKMANLRFTGGEVPIRTVDGVIASGLRKLGAILADGVQTGCNSVTNPGTLLGKKSMLMPNKTANSGYHPPHSLIRK
jgi:hypothetical protein